MGVVELVMRVGAERVDDSDFVVEGAADEVLAERGSGRTAG